MKTFFVKIGQFLGLILEIIIVVIDSVLEFISSAGDFE